MRRKVGKTGNPESPSLIVTLPQEWWEQHGIKPGDDLLMLANRDLHIVAPGYEGEMDREIHEYAQRMKPNVKEKKGE